MTGDATLRAWLLLAAFCAAVFAPRSARAQDDWLELEQEVEQEDDAQTQDEADPDAQLGLSDDEQSEGSARDDADAAQDDDELDTDADSEPGEEPDAQDAAASLQDAVAQESSEQDARSLRIEVGVGAGVGVRGFTRPTQYGLQKLPDAAFPALEAVARIHFWPNNDWSLQTLFAYQTSIGLTVREEPLFALPEEVDARSSHAEASLAPSTRLSDTFSLAFPVGFVLRSFVPTVHNQRTPEYTLAGPHLRIELLARAGETLSIRLGPEVQWLLLIDNTLQRNGVGSQGVALGAELAVEARLGRHVGLALAYRESRAMASSTGAQFLDVERAFTTRLLGRF